MSKGLIFVLILILVGILMLLAKNFIIKLQGPSQKKDYPLDVRNRQIIIGGVSFIITGIILFIHFLLN
jgi:hypothetical protein